MNIAKRRCLALVPIRRLLPFVIGVFSLENHGVRRSPPSQARSNHRATVRVSPRCAVSAALLEVLALTGRFRSRHELACTWQDERLWTAGRVDGAVFAFRVLGATGEIEDMGKGISIDGAGYVWRVGKSTATRIDADSGAFDAYAGLDGAYSYSDMTGVGIANANGCAPVG